LGIVHDGFRPLATSHGQFIVDVAARNDYSMVSGVRCQVITIIFKFDLVSFNFGHYIKFIYDVGTQKGRK